MCYLNWLTRGTLIFFASTLSVVAYAGDVEFDLPSSIECRDVTTREFITAHPHLKMIEATLRISAKLGDGDSDDIVDFEYSIATGQQMRVQQYLPSTTLESAVSDDQIEVTAGAENTRATGVEAQLPVKPLLISASHEKSSKQTATSHYQQLAAKDVVLASGTINREHGVFFRIRPSRSASLEGGREFTIVASVPRSWRGGLCAITCEAKATKRSIVSSSLVSIGAVQSRVGMYLAGDTDASVAAEGLRVSQDSLDAALERLASKGPIAKVSTGTLRLFSSDKVAAEERELRLAEQKVCEFQNYLESLAGN